MRIEKPPDWGAERSYPLKDNAKSNGVSLVAVAIVQTGRHLRRQFLKHPGFLKYPSLTSSSLLLGAERPSLTAIIRMNVTDRTDS